MIYTSSHENWKTNKLKTYAISGNRGKDVQYVGDCYPKLAPKLSFWKVWHNNIGKVDEIANNEFYIREYYRMVLSSLDVSKVYKELDDSVLLCYENHDEFCHRHIVAAWFELLLNVSVSEVMIRNGHVEIVDKPGYIKEYLRKILLEDNKLPEDNGKKLVKVVNFDKNIK